MEFQARLPRPVAPALALLALLSSCGSGSPEEPIASEADPLFGTPLVVNGKTVSTYELKRALVAGEHGRSLLEAAKLSILIDEEIEREIEKGAPPERFKISPKDVDAAVEEADEMIKKEFPKGEFTTARELTPYTENVWRDQLKLTELFDRVFLPDNPYDYPETTVAALTAQSPEFVDRLKEGWDQRELSGLEQDPQNQALFRTLMRQLIMGLINRAAEVKTPADGLPAEVALEVNGKRIMVDEIWAQIEDRIAPDDVRKVKLWFAKTMALEDKLKEEGVFLGDEEFEQAYFEHTDPYAGSPFSIPMVAVNFKKFPSEEAYKQHYRLEQSYKRLISDEINEENLTAHLSRASNLLGLATVDCEVILIPAWDFVKGRYKENGWEYAEKRVKEAMQLLADGTPWDEVIEEYSEFYEPPIGLSAQNMASNQYTWDKGRFGPINRNELVQKLGESDYSHFLLGYSIADTIYFDLEAGPPSQPFEGPWGYYIARVTGRTPPTNQINMNENEGHRTLVEQDYLACRLNEYAVQVLAQADVRGLEPGGTTP